MSDWERLLLLVILSPLLWLQARYVRRTTPRMPEPPGERVGTCGCGPLIRLLVAGDSGAAGVGAPSQEQALCGQLVQRLSRQHTVHWRVLAVNGLDSHGLMRLLQSFPAAAFDVVVLSVGANDATSLCAPTPWAHWQHQLAALIEDRFKPDLLVHTAVPPMHACAALPQPLRWFMGRWARQMNAMLQGQLVDQAQRTLHWHPESTARSGLAADGIHPSAAGYSAWADALSRHILAERSGPF